MVANYPKTYTVPHPSDCTKFYMCQELACNNFGRKCWKAHLMQCPQNTGFDTNINACNWMRKLPSKCSKGIYWLIMIFLKKCLNVYDNYSKISNILFFINRNAEKIIQVLELKYEFRCKNTAEAKKKRKTKQEREKSKQKEVHAKTYQQRVQFVNTKRKIFKKGEITTY